MGSLLIKYIPYEKHLKSRNPALNIPRRHEAVATDTVFSDTPAVDSGVKQAQVFVGRDTLVADAYPMKNGEAICQHPRAYHYEAGSYGQASQ